MSERRRRALGLVGPGASMLIIAAAGSAAGPYLQLTLAFVCIAALVGAALVVLVGQARVITLASGAVMALGAYGSTLAVIELGLPYLAGLVVAMLTGAVAGVVMAIPALRFQSHHIAMVTMVFQYIVTIALREWSDLTGGALGLRVPAAQLFGVAVTGDLANLWLIAGLTALAIGALTVVARGGFGRTLRALSSSEVAATAFGVDGAHFRIAAFAISSAAVGLAGALLAPRVRILDPDSFGFTQSILMLGYPIIGGATSLWGGIVGGSVMKLAPELLRGAQEYQELILAAVVVAIVVFMPSGLAGLWRPRRSPADTAGPMRAPVQASAITEPMPPGSDSAIAISGLTQSYGALRAVDALSLTVAAGTIHGVIGPNGAGKTTLFNAISGFVAPDAGAIRLFGHDVTAEPARRRIEHGMTRTFQQVALFGGLSALDNVLLGLGANRVGACLSASIGEALGGRADRLRRDRAHAALDAVGLADLAARRADTLALGDQRRLEIARALVSEPRLILLDEPVAGVARDEEERLLGLLRRLNAERAITMLVIEHNVRFVRQLCGIVSVMAGGRLILEAPPEQAVAAPEVRALYFGEARA